MHNFCQAYAKDSLLVCKKYSSTFFWLGLYMIFLPIDFTYWKSARLLLSLIVAHTCSLSPNTSLLIRASMFIWPFSSYKLKSGMKLSWDYTKILLLACDLMLSSTLLSSEQASIYAHEAHPLRRTVLFLVHPNTKYPQIFITMWALKFLSSSHLPNSSNGHTDI